MKSKEAIRSRIINYANLVWNTKRVDSIHPLIHLMIESLCNELYLLDNKLHDIDAAILDKLVQNLAPTQFSYVRAASTIVLTRPDRNRFFLNHKTEFFVKELPDYLQRKNIRSVVFSPVTDVKLSNLGISHVFFNQKLWKTDNLGNKKLIAQSSKRTSGNKMWLLIDNPAKIKQIKDLYFYIDFPHLDDSHYYYDSLSLLQWQAEGRILETDEGFPILPDVNLSKVEEEILSYYQIHYLTLRTALNLMDKLHLTIPNELISLLDQETASLPPEGYWFSIDFPAHYEVADLEKVQILLNAFPALNRRYVAHRQSLDALADVVALPSEIGEEFLELQKIQDSNKHHYHFDDTSNKSVQGIYHLEPIKKKEMDENKLYDHLELLIDVLESERTVFPKIDRDQIIEIQNELAALLENDEQKVITNILNNYAEVARLSINPREETEGVDVAYWTTLAETINDLPAHTGLMASKITALNKAETTLVTPVTGGRIFYDLDSLKAINGFYLTAKGRILTKHDILSFCRLEIGRYAKEIDAVRCAKISNKPGEGIVNAMEIQVTPHEHYREFFKQKDVSRQLIMRLSALSPIHYNYVIKIIE